MSFVQHLLKICSMSLSSENFEITDGPFIKPGYFGCDIGPQTLQKYKEVIAKSKHYFLEWTYGAF